MLMFQLPGNSSFEEVILLNQEIYCHSGLQINSTKFLTKSSGHRRKPSVDIVFKYGTEQLFPTWLVTIWTQRISS